MSASAGISLKVMVTLSSTLMLACVKGLAGALPVGEVIFFRSLVGILTLLIWLHAQGGILQGIKTRKVRGHLGRGLAGTCSMYLSHLSLMYISLTDATAINYAAPLFTVLLAAMVLRENGAAQPLAVGDRRLCRHRGYVSGHLSLSGPPRLSVESLASSVGVLLALLSALCTAGALIQIRYLSGKERPGAIAFWFIAMTGATSLLTLPFGWAIPHGEQLLLLLGCGLFGGLTQILLTLSMRYADASLLAPFYYSLLLWSVMIGLIFTGALPAKMTLIGTSVVACAGIYTVLSERRRRGADHAQ
ncbi:DMT family transporter [Candidatus Pantoea persica]|uniref:DMT family transporter n=1 Tax=Candidatus Pantoea persica TaxID=2518128 RepID=UPI002867BCC4|nr:DMT family transporter [Candidatus Pantoea persica]MBA2814020.1 EamA-like transporter family protein [Candidatus Pantoea persica]